MRRLFRTTGLALALLAAGTLTPVSAEAHSASGPPCFGAGSNVAFYDNFTSASALRPWGALTGRYANRTKTYAPQLQWYTPKAVSVSGGHLNITASQHGKGYWSGRISTQSSCNLLYGRIEARIWTPAGQGLWPAFWLEDQGDHHEIDIMESLGERPTLFYSGVHTASIWDVHSASGSFAGSWHVYGVLWRPRQVTFTIDGHPYCSRPEAIDSPLFVVLDLAVGGWAGPPDASTIFPSAMQVDWVKAYKFGHAPPLSSPASQQCQLLYESPMAGL